MGRVQAIGLEAAQQMQGKVWQQETLAAAAIEGEKLDLASVRSSVHWRLGLVDRPEISRDIEGLVEVLQDATHGHAQALGAGC